jgi:hypothetical protein
MPMSQGTPGVIVLSAMIVACGGSSTPSASSGPGDGGGPVTPGGPAGDARASVTGAYHGVSIVAVDAFGAATPPVDATGIGGTKIYLVDQSGICQAVVRQPDGQLELRQQFANLGYVEIYLLKTSWPPPSGTYPVVFGPAQGKATVSLKRVGAVCKVAYNSVYAETGEYGGNVTITSSSNNEVSGTFEATMGDQTLGGSFTAPLCSPARAPSAACK